MMNRAKSRIYIYIFVLELPCTLPNVHTCCMNNAHVIRLHVQQKYL